MVKESPPHPTPSSQGISTTPYPLFQRSLHYTLPLFPRSLHYTLPPLPKESTPHPTPSSQGFHTTPCPLFLRSAQHTLRPLSWPNSLPHLPEIIPRFLLSVLSRPCWNFHWCVYIFFSSHFFCAPCRFKVWMSWLSTSSELLNYACEFAQQSNKLHLNSID